jgi:hypothetical protein
VISFVSFSFLDPKLYPHQSEHLALITGFVSISYLTTQFLSINWIFTVLGQLLATGAAIDFFVKGLGYRFDKIGFGMCLTVLASGMNCYFLELKDKKEFLDMINTDLMQSDL